MEWWEKDEFWMNFEPILFDEERIKNSSTEVEKIISILNLKEKDKILDLCCGIGRHAIEFTKRNFIVSGVDRNEYFIEKCKKRAKEENLNIEFIKSDIRSFVRKNEFDAIINIFTSFGYFENIDDDRKVIKNCFDSLKEGGKFLIDMNGKETLARIFRQRDWYRVNDYIVLEERRILDDWEKIESKWILIKNNEIKEFKIILRLYSAFEIKSLFRDCGFRNIEIYGDLNGSFYDNKASRLIVIGTK